MTKRAVDLSVQELAAMGAKAARLAVHASQAAGLVVTGTIDVYEAGQAASSLAQLHPSGTVTLVEEGARPSRGAKPLRRRPRRRRVAD
jgi:hypothetical protein